MSDDKAIHVAFYPSDWLAGTRGLSLAETGLYITLVAMMYETAAPIEADIPRIARVCACPVSKLTGLLGNLVRYGKIIKLADGRLWNERAEREISAARVKIDIASERAKKAANARWGKTGQVINFESLKRPFLNQISEPTSDDLSNEINKGPMHEHSLRNAIQNQNQNRRRRRYSAHAREIFPSILDIIGMPADQASGYWLPASAIPHIEAWLTDLNLPPDAILQTVQAEMDRVPDAQPEGPKAFDRAMRRTATALQQPSLKPDAGAPPAAINPAQVKVDLSRLNDDGSLA